TKGVELRGVVVRDTGEPVADASVNAMSPAAPFSRGARTDAGGNFVLGGLAPGTYSVVARYESLNETVRDVDPATAGVLRIVLKSGGIVTGRVLGLDDAELAVTMILVRGSGAGTQGSVRHDGTFRVEGAPVGPVEVVAMVRGVAGMRSSIPKNVDVTAGAEAWVEIDFQTGNEVTGRVTRNGEPVEGARVMFSPRDRDAQSQGATISGTGGEYAVSGLLDGTYDVRVFDMGSSTPFMTEYEVRGSGRFDIQLRAGSVTGRVVDASTLEPVEGASVTLDATEGRQRFPGVIRSDSAGRFILDGVATGQYRLRVLKEGFAQETQDVTVVDGERSEVEVRLQTSPGAELRIVDARDGRPLSAFLSVADATGQVVYEEYLRVEGGAHTIPLPPGSYRAIVTAGGYAPVTFDLPAPSGERTIGLGRGG
ncbi:MAG: carboxypeptidase regulatory-like domain-containing protein, partial [Thermoanaerobaculia bacterium]